MRQVTHARKSSFSGGGNDCIEAGYASDTTVCLYETEDLGHELGSDIIVGCEKFATLIAGVADGTFVHDVDGSDNLVCIKAPELCSGDLVTSRKNLEAFIRGIEEGEFNRFSQRRLHTTV